VNWLLDTHIAIWWQLGHSRLSKEALKILENPEHSLRLSVISLWEITLKHQVGKLEIDAKFTEDNCEKFGIKLIPLLPQHMRKFAGIPISHRDPFDRMLVAQADSTPLYLMTQDKTLAGLSPMVKVFS
jgi:PIN domain nuclease of toxin-antitoxin system